MNRMLFVVLLSMTSLLYADPQPFKNLTGDVPVNDVQQGAIQLPLILWGGDLPFLIANGGVDTKPDSIYGKMGLKIKITHGDDPVQQVYVMLHDGKPLAIRPPASVRLEVVEAEDAVKGDTATNAKKPVKVESGATVNVPIFIKKGDMIVINPEDGSYIERSN
jgi:hypothetical protein